MAHVALHNFLTYDTRTNKSNRSRDNPSGI
jgi:hypothetical protein